MSAREGLILGKNRKECAAASQWKSIFMLIFTQKAWLAFQCPAALSLVPIPPVSVDNGLAYEHRSAHIWVCRSLLLLGWLLGCVWVLFMRHVLNRAVQGWGWEGSLGAWDEPEADVHGLWVQPVFLRLWGWLFHSWNTLPLDVRVAACCFWGRSRLAQELLHGSLTQT